MNKKKSKKKKTLRELELERSEVVKTIRKFEKMPKELEESGAIPKYQKLSKQIIELKVKDIRKNCKNKQIFEKAKKFFLEYGVCFLHPDGTINEGYNQVFTHTFKENEELKAQCNKCGKCCILMYDDKVSKESNFTFHPDITCPNLIKLEDGTTECKIYEDPKRLGSYVGKSCHCIPRELQRKIWPDCPYNEVVSKNAERWNKWKKEGIF